MSLIPATILTGFLGSGKTTFINYLLHSTEHKLRLAIVENEFGFFCMLSTIMTTTKRSVSFQLKLEAFWPQT